MDLVGCAVCRLQLPMWIKHDFEPCSTFWISNVVSRSCLGRGWHGEERTAPLNGQNV